MATRIASRMISSVWSAYSIELENLTESSIIGSCRTNWMRPRRMRRSVTRARWPPMKITGSFSTLAHWIAGIMLAMPGPSVPMQTAGLPVMRAAAAAMWPAEASWCGETTVQPRRSASRNRWTKFGSGMPNSVLIPSASNRSSMRL